MRDCGRSQYGHIAAPRVQGEQPRHFRQQGSSSKNCGKKSRPDAQLEILLCSALAWLHCEDGAIPRFRRRDPCKPRRADRDRAAEGADCRAGGRERVLARRGCNGRRRPLGKSAPGLRTYGSARHAGSLQVQWWLRSALQMRRGSAWFRSRCPRVIVPFLAASLNVATAICARSSCKVPRYSAQTSKLGEA